ncbi:hypothetical protein IFM89_003282 [Coptis chinensis]|uniref:Uncharacterized protein n=1 Tax=Coptis chinensis TaxID=261450 RepID=A0A835HTR4_9MAGN|nr:hypothetical protein IFM89_003282 [Coptis chinensis]
MMGAYEGNPSWNNNMERGRGGIGNLENKFTGLTVVNDRDESSSSSINDDRLIQVMKAVEAAETAIKQQVEENNQLRTELQKRTLELERRKSNDPADRLSHLDALRDGHIHGPFGARQPFSMVEGQEDRFRWKDETPLVDRKGTLVVHENVMQKNEDPSLHTRAERPHYSENSNVNGLLKVLPSGHAGVDNGGVSQFSSPSSRSISPNRYQREGEYDNKNNASNHGLIPISEVDERNSLWKQVLFSYVECGQYDEAQIRNEKYVLEKRIAYMRMAFDQQQQDLVDAASKSLSYRQDIIEENIRLTYALQAAQQERSTFVSSLLPLLEEYSLQPPVQDAQSIVSNLKVLLKHLQEKLLVTEAKLKESQYQVGPWRSELSNLPNFTSQSPSPSIGATLTTSNIMGLELVPQPAYSHRQTPLSPSSDGQKTTDWDQLVQHNPRTGFVGVPGKSVDPDNFGRPVPSAGRNSAAQDVPAQLASQGESHAKRFSEEITRKQPSFGDLLSGSEADDTDAAGREPSGPWSSGNSPYMTPTHDDPNSSFSPFLPPVLEEPSSSFSEAGEDDPLPAIDGLQISGEAFPGQELQACGYSINGTTSCNFEWVRYLEDGSVNYIDGAKQPNYLVTADDVDTYLAIEVQPLDNRKRKGELVKVFANEQRKISCGKPIHFYLLKLSTEDGLIEIYEGGGSPYSVAYYRVILLQRPEDGTFYDIVGLRKILQCLYFIFVNTDPEMQEQIEKSLYSGHASYDVSLAARYLDIWEPAILAIKREGYSIKCIGTRDVVVTEKFLQRTAVQFLLLFSFS